eukprot:gene1817-1103_t
MPFRFLFFLFIIIIIIFCTFSGFWDLHIPLDTLDTHNRLLCTFPFCFFFLFFIISVFFWASLPLSCLTKEPLNKKHHPYCIPRCLHVCPILLWRRVCDTAVGPGGVDSFLFKTLKSSRRYIDAHRRTTSSRTGARQSESIPTYIVLERETNSIRSVAFKRTERKGQPQPQPQPQQRVLLRANQQAHKKEKFDKESFTTPRRRRRNKLSSESHSPLRFLLYPFSFVDQSSISYLTSLSIPLPPSLSHSLLSVLSPHLCTSSPHVFSDFYFFYISIQLHPAFTHRKIKNKAIHKKRFHLFYLFIYLFFNFLLYFNSRIPTHTHPSSRSTYIVDLFHLNLTTRSRMSLASPRQGIPQHQQLYRRSDAHLSARGSGDAFLRTASQTSRGSSGPQQRRGSLGPGPEAVFTRLYSNLSSGAAENRRSSRHQRTRSAGRRLPTPPGARDQQQQQQQQRHRNADASLAARGGPGLGNGTDNERKMLLMALHPNTVAATAAYKGGKAAARTAAQPLCSGMRIAPAAGTRAAPASYGPPHEEEGSGYHHRQQSSSSLDNISAIAPPSSHPRDHSDRGMRPHAPRREEERKGTPNPAPIPAASWLPYDACSGTYNTILYPRHEKGEAERTDRERHQTKAPHHAEQHAVDHHQKNRRRAEEVEAEGRQPLPPSLQAVLQRHERALSGDELAAVRASSPGSRCAALRMIFEGHSPEATVRFLLHRHEKKKGARGRSAPDLTAAAPVHARSDNRSDLASSTRLRHHQHISSQPCNDKELQAELHATARDEPSIWKPLHAQQREAVDDQEEEEEEEEAAEYSASLQRNSDNSFALRPSSPSAQMLTSTTSSRRRQADEPKRAPSPSYHHQRSSDKAQRHDATSTRQDSSCFGSTATRRHSSRRTGGSEKRTSSGADRLAPPAARGSYQTRIVVAEEEQEESATQRRQRNSGNISNTFRRTASNCSVDSNCSSLLSISLLSLQRSCSASARARLRRQQRREAEAKKFYHQQHPDEDNTEEEVQRASELLRREHGFTVALEMEQQQQQKRREQQAAAAAKEEEERCRRQQEDQAERERLLAASAPADRPASPSRANDDIPRPRFLRTQAAAAINTTGISSAPRTGQGAVPPSTSAPSNANFISTAAFTAPLPPFYSDGAGNCLHHESHGQSSTATRADETEQTIHRRPPHRHEDDEEEEEEEGKNEFKTPEAAAGSEAAAARAARESRLETVGRRRTKSDLDDEAARNEKGHRSPKRSTSYDKHRHEHESGETKGSRSRSRSSTGERPLIRLSTGTPPPPPPSSSPSHGTAAGHVHPAALPQQPTRGISYLREITVSPPSSMDEEAEAEARGARRRAGHEGPAPPLSHSGADAAYHRGGGELQKGSDGSIQGRLMRPTPAAPPSSATSPQQQQQQAHAAETLTAKKHITAAGGGGGRLHAALSSWEHKYEAYLARYHLYTTNTSSTPISSTPISSTPISSTPISSTPISSSSLYTKRDGGGTHCKQPPPPPPPLKNEKPTAPSLVERRSCSSSQDADVALAATRTFPSSSNKTETHNSGNTRPAPPSTRGAERVETAMPPPPMQGISTAAAAGTGTGTGTGAGTGKTSSKSASLTSVLARAPPQLEEVKANPLLSSGSGGEWSRDASPSVQPPPNCTRVITYLPSSSPEGEGSRGNAGASLHVPLGSVRQELMILKEWEAVQPSRPGAASAKNRVVRPYTPAPQGKHMSGTSSTRTAKDDGSFMVPVLQHGHTAEPSPAVGSRAREDSSVASSSLDPANHQRFTRINTAPPAFEGGGGEGNVPESALPHRRAETKTTIESSPSQQQQQAYHQTSSAANRHSVDSLGDEEEERIAAAVLRFARMDTAPPTGTPPPPPSSQGPEAKAAAVAYGTEMMEMDEEDQLALRPTTVMRRRDGVGAKENNSNNNSNNDVKKKMNKKKQTAAASRYRGGGTGDDDVEDDTEPRIGGSYYDLRCLQAPRAAAAAAARHEQQQQQHQHRVPSLAYGGSIFDETPAYLVGNRRLPPQGPQRRGCTARNEEPQRHQDRSMAFCRSATQISSHGFTARTDHDAFIRSEQQQQQQQHTRRGARERAGPGAAGRETLKRTHSAPVVVYRAVYRDAAADAPLVTSVREEQQVLFILFLFLYTWTLDGTLGPRSPPPTIHNRYQLYTRPIYDIISLLILYKYRQESGEREMQADRYRDGAALPCTAPPQGCLIPIPTYC